MPEIADAQLDIFVGKDGNDNYQLYTSEEATVPLPSHFITLNPGTLSEINFKVKSSLVGAEFVDSSYLQWVATPAETIISLTRPLATHVKLIINNNSQGGEFPFSIFMKGEGGIPIPIFAQSNGVPVDPTVVEKPGGG